MYRHFAGTCHHHVHGQQSNQGGITVHSMGSGTRRRRERFILNADAVC
jgi:hypothetical protein